MLALLLTLGCLAALIALWRVGPERAVLAVILPLMMLWPYGSGFRFKGVEIDPFMLAIVPVALALAWKYRSRWQHTVTDLLVFAYALSTMMSNWNSDGQSAGLALGTATLLACVPPYIIGKVGIEQAGLRVSWIKRFVTLAFAVSLLSVYEYRMERDWFREIADRLFEHKTHLVMQFRWGYGRISGPYTHPILADCILLSALMFAVWISSRKLWENKFRRLEFLPGRKATYLLVGLAAGVWMTQSRGPWLAGAFGILLVIAARARRQKRALFYVTLVSIVLAGIFYVVLNRYTAVNHAAGSMDQQNAQYRRLLLVNYTPEIMRGGWLGFGLHFPIVDGQDSIDNEYLNITLTQGFLGLTIFVLLILGTSARLLRVALTTRDRTDASFAICLLGIFVTLALSITTVFLGAQTYTLFFLLVGWSQALRPRPAVAPALQPAVAPLAPSSLRYQYRRVWS